MSLHSFLKDYENKGFEILLSGSQVYAFFQPEFNIGIYFFSTHIIEVFHESLQWKVLFVQMDQYKNDNLINSQ